MKVLILTITAGEGHNSTAKAVASALTESGAECRIVDCYKEINPLLYGIVARGYLLAVSSFKKIYGGIYKKLEKRSKNAYRRSFTRMSNSAVSGRIARLVREYDPDVIVYTHVFCGGVLDVIKQKHGIRAKTVGIVTDFAMHPFWEEALRTDCVVVPNGLVVPSALKKGFLLSQIHPIGIPINPRFAVTHDRDTVLRSLGLDTDKRTLLIMGGSMGYGNLAETIKGLDKIEADFQMICVCGNNEKAKSSIDALELSKKIVNFGYTDRVSELMDASDCIVTKPGGLTSSEALAKRLPMIIHTPIPGQEDRNTEFFVNSGVAVAVTKSYTIELAVAHVFENTARIRAMRDCIEELRRPNAVADLVQLVTRLAAENERIREFQNAPTKE